MRKLILLLLVFASFTSGCDTADGEIIVLPRGFRGHILIIFNQKNGVQSKYKNGKRLYNIPFNGILKVQSSPNAGWKNLPQFYFEKINEESAISYRPVLDKVKSSDLLFAYGGIAGSVVKDTVTKERIEFLEYYVGTKSEIERDQAETEKLDIIKLAE